MRFSLINNERIEAKPELSGICPGCSEPVIAKCGKQRIWHWAHRSKKICDKWGEPETEWHRNWKSKFLLEWQECRQQDQSSGEWHIADVRTAHGLVIEFQHSHLNPQERAARENFYKNMVWVVDGARLKRDYPRFVKARIDFRPTERTGFFIVHFPDECFPAAWLESTVPVLFDFQNVLTNEGSSKVSEPLWCLLPGRAERYAIIVAIPQEQFVETVSSRSYLLPAREIVEATAHNIRQAWQKEQMRVAQNFMLHQQFSKRFRRRRYARF